MKLNKGWMELELVNAGTLSREPLQHYGVVVAHDPLEYFPESLIGKKVYLSSNYMLINGRVFTQDNNVIAYED